MMKTVLIEKEGIQEALTLEQFEKRMGVRFIPQLDFSDFRIVQCLSKKCAKLRNKKQLDREQIWLGSYFQKELESPFFPDVVIRYIDSVLGWGVFANRDFKKTEFIAEYAGRVRRRRRADIHNAYCFEYVLASGIKTPYTIDALDQGGISRFINHSASPNLLTALATLHDISHVVLFTKEPIAKGTQLCYDYGPDYWSRRSSPLPI